MEIKAVNVNHALAEGLHYIRVAGIKEQSRNGPVLVAPEPVMTIYERPCERVLFSPLRDANPFFHLMEALWMLAGRDDIEWPAYFAKQIREYSDDGKTLHGAYGHRWRTLFGGDQLFILANELKRNPTSRRCVLQMWDIVIGGDLSKSILGGKDVPCNTHAYFDARDGKLNMTVCCRSNDIWWGAYGANAVHFSVLQEYLAAWVGVPVGVYRQFSNNWHLYTDLVPEGNLFALAVNAEDHDYYAIYDDIKPFSLVSTSIEQWDQDLKQFMQDPGNHNKLYHDDFFNFVAYPMYRAFFDRKNKSGTGLEWAKEIKATDWRQACVEWIGRREARKGVVNEAR